VGWRLAYARSLFRSLMRIRRWHRSCTMAEMVEAVEASARDLAPAGEREMRAVLKDWWFWRHSFLGIYRNPCLYFSMLALAYELANGREAEVNVWLSTGILGDRGHCWITRDGQMLYDRDRTAVPATAERLGRRGRIVYWWDDGGRRF